MTQLVRFIRNPGENQANAKWIPDIRLPTDSGMTKTVLWILKRSPSLAKLMPKAYRTGRYIPRVIGRSFLFWGWIRLDTRTPAARWLWLELQEHNYLRLCGFAWILSRIGLYL